MAHGVPGPAPQTAKREQFARLIAHGVSNREACRVVGVNRRTGTRWRYGRSITGSSGRRLDYPAVVTARKSEISARYLCEDERVLIADLTGRGETVRAIAGVLDRSPSTISREVRRNRDAASGEYRPFTAQRLAAARRARPRQGKLARDPVLREFVQAGLKKRWSPEQVCHEVRREFPDDPARHLVHETVYQAIYRPDLGGLQRDLPRVLRTGRRRRRPRRRADARRPGSLVDMTMIDQRPAEADDRTVPGHWEGDLITGAANRSAIGTLVERSSRLVILLHLPAGRHTADAVRDALVDAMSRVPAHLRRSLTWDQGKEMALHSEIAQALGMPVFFCEKASPWRGPATRTPTGFFASTSRLVWGERWRGRICCP